MAIPELVGHDMLTSDAHERLCVLLSFILFLSSIRFGDVNEGRGKRVVGDEGGCKADDGK